MKAQSKVAKSNAPESTGTMPVKQQPSWHAGAAEGLSQSRIRYSLAAVPTFATSDTTAKSSPSNFAFKGGPRINIQAKLMVGAVNDPLEMEADRVAERVMQMPEPHTASQADHTQSASTADRGTHAGAHAGGTLQGKCDCGGSCDDCQKKQQDDSPVKLQMKAAGEGSAHGMEAPPIVREVLRSSGRPLDSATRAFMEPRFGHDFRHVRIHTDAQAAESAKVVGARAYTVGSNVVFGPGEYGPRSAAGQNLLGHELAHVVQQGNSGSAMRVQRKASADDQKKHDAAVEFHKKQQKQVADLLDKGSKIKRDAAKGPLDGNNLFANTVDLLIKKKMALTVLTPTHYSTLDKPFYFDANVQHDTIGGNYQADPNVQGSGTITPPSPGTLGLTMVKKAQSQGLVSTPKVEHELKRVPYDPNSKEKMPEEKPKKPTQPVLPAMSWSVAEVQLFIPRTEQDGLVTESELRNTFVHEGQHVADLNYLQTLDFNDWHSVFDRYTSEFRAYWLQPPNAGPCSEGNCLPGMGNFPASSPIAASEKQEPITLPQGADCKTCAPSSAGGSSAATSKTPKMKDERQNSIFRKLLSTDYAQDRFACFYVCDQNFSDAVDAYVLPAGENVANSSRLIDLRVELQSLAPTMTHAELDKTKFVDAIKALDDLDWAFLKDRQVKGNKGMQLSEPLWKLLNKAAPKAIVDAMISVVDKKNPAKEIDKALDAALTKIK